MKHDMKDRFADRRVALIPLLATLACHASDATRADAPHHVVETDVPELDEFLAQIDVATNQMVNGDSHLWQLYSHAPDATLFGGWGGHEKGWEQLEARWRMVIGRYRTGKMTIEPIAKHVSEDLAVTVQFVRGEATFSDGSAGKVGLRVTHVLRREDGKWRIVHRHADEQMTLLPISSHIQPDDR
jgi:ketosteroid isomerase-like protein